MSDRSTRYGLLALACAALFSFTGVFNHSLWPPDEVRVAEIGREMLLGGDPLVPTLVGEPFLEKPPLYWWVMTGLYALLGVSDGVARLTSALACFATLLVAFRLASRIADRRAGLLAVLVLGSIAGFMVNSHRCIVDPWLGFFVFLGYTAYVEAAILAGRRTWGALIGIYVAATLAFLTKGPIGPALLIGPMAVDILVGRRWGFLRSWVHLPGILLLAVGCTAWPLLLYLRGGRELLDGFLIPNVLGRLMGPEDGSYVGGHVRPIYYYLLHGPQAVLPWLVALPWVFHWLHRRTPPEGWSRQAMRFVAWVFPLGMLFLSLPGTKRQLYLLPLIPPLAVAVGVWLSGFRRGSPRLPTIVAAAAFGVAITLNVVGYPLLDKGREVRSIAEDLARLDASRPAIVGYRLDELGRSMVPFYTGVPLTTVGSPEGLTEHLESAPEGAKVLVGEKIQPDGGMRDVFPDEVRPRLTLVRQWEVVGRRRGYALYELVEPESPGTEGDGR